MVLGQKRLLCGSSDHTGLGTLCHPPTSGLGDGRAGAHRNQGSVRLQLTVSRDGPLLWAEGEGRVERAVAEKP